MAIGALQDEFQRLRDHLDELQAKIEAAVGELVEVVNVEDVTTDTAKFLFALLGKGGSKVVVKTFEDGKQFKIYPLQRGVRDADAISYMGISDVTGINNMPYNNNKPAWNEKEIEAAQAENKEAEEESDEAFIELRKQRLQNYQGDFRYPPTLENGWELWELQELWKGRPELKPDA